MAEALLQARGLTVARGGVPVLAGVDLDIRAGETLALVGPSGSGKSTLARALLRLDPLRAGAIRFAGEDWLALKGAALRRRRAAMQMVFQDPLSAFNPRATVGEVLDEPLRIHGLPRAVASLLEQVGLGADLAARGVEEISGGQRQRVAIARTLATRPALIVLDEAVSALDATLRAEVLELLRRIQAERGTAYLFITHDLAVAARIAARIAVMERGRIVENRPARELIADPRTDLSKALIEAAPRLIVQG